MQKEIKPQNIVEIIGEHVKLKPSGKSFKGLCPFHKEKTPSFMVSPEKDIFYCFGCGKSGSASDFIFELNQIHT
jgi:DNA primase